ncbi:nitric oxide reductase activation protein NorD [Skermania piniformis]|uniref:VWA domain-containing protein n=1 Tax=Skermania pinensis TaxID=39122 RepID=A0ABX8S522_9ACTN|nr:VWA domain-containing protein [Skermania piniformis]QXQ12937.1 VWA domain-containing protein [Skermania piniformis]
MTSGDSNDAMSVERSYGVTAVAFSGQRRTGARLITGPRREFGLSRARRVVDVPYPVLGTDWRRSTVTCGIALQCAPSKDLIGEHDLHELAPRQLAALSLVEGGVAAGWIADRLPGLLPEITRLVPHLEIADQDLTGAEIISRAIDLARSKTPLTGHPVLGALPLRAPARRPLAAAIHRTYSRMPWTSARSDAKRAMSVPVGGDGGVRNANLPLPSRPENDEPEIRADRRAGIPYPEWNMWTKAFLPNHVAVLERRLTTQSGPLGTVPPEIGTWFARNTHRAMRSGLEDGSDVDVDRYVAHYLDTMTGEAGPPRIFRELLPVARDVATAVLLDGSSSLGAHQGRAFQIELACAGALSRAMTLTGEHHGIFVFSGNTRHRVDVACLKDFADRRFVDPGHQGLRAGGYTRLGAPIRHLTRRLLDQPAERRLLIVIGDGLVSDEGYEGRYAWADVAHALEEAEEAGVCLYYIGIGPVRVDPLPEIFGDRRSRRLRRVDQLAEVLALIHRELVAR